jgi:hypothetical protein
MPTKRRGCLQARQQGIRETWMPIAEVLRSSAKAQGPPRRAQDVEGKWGPVAPWYLVVLSETICRVKEAETESCGSKATRPWPDLARSEQCVVDSSIQLRDQSRSRCLLLRHVKLQCLPQDHQWSEPPKIAATMTCVRSSLDQNNALYLSQSDFFNQ